MKHFCNILKVKHFSVKIQIVTKMSYFCNKLISREDLVKSMLLTQNLLKFNKNLINRNLTQNLHKLNTSNQVSPRLYITYLALLPRYLIYASCKLGLRAGRQAAS